MSLKEFSTEELLEEIDRREIKIPDTVNFTYYVHDSYTFGEFKEWIADNTDYYFSDAILDKARNAFYEIALNCEMDTRTGEVKILSTGK